MNILAITQARIGSTRLPAKVLKMVNDESLLEIHIKRILKSKLITNIVIATTNEPGVEAIEDIARKMEVGIYKGSVNDVLGRFYYAALSYTPDYIVRITSDCPLIDPFVIDEIIVRCINSGCDYVSNTLSPTFPDGIDTEVFKFSALKKAFNEASLQSEREHVTPYIKKHSSFHGENLFSSENFNNGIDYSSIRITVDTIEDFDVIKYLIEQLGDDKGWLDYVDLLKRNPHIQTINSAHKRDEGYQKSINEDKIITK